MQGDNWAVAKRVLVVEDNELNLKLFCDLLRAHGFVVEPVKDGREVLDKARSFVPNLIVMDIQLPHVSGSGTDRTDQEGPTAQDHSDHGGNRLCRQG